ncbi:MAG: AP-2 complex subunit sigma [Ramalina farinacea]|uniref:AP-2 complex subunit sigma n=1 Tax=Ramalina farinacea TaxID=258253 RepID=A0AA43QKU3_9LECA|nr:AP-2 complex subunit sigma [Ramalina farinacea]
MESSSSSSSSSSSGEDISNVDRAQHRAMIQFADLRAIDGILAADDMSAAVRATAQLRMTGQQLVEYLQQPHVQKQIRNALLIALAAGFGTYGLIMCAGFGSAGVAAAMVLSFILIQNRQGKTRLAKWYAPYSDEDKVRLKGEVHRLIAPRDQKHQSNFVEFRSLKIVYRRYAGLFFCVCVDANDNELAYLEAIHFFVEVLDSFFGNVCELDLVFNFYKVYAILDEVFLAGEIEETSKQVVLQRLEYLDKLE